MMVITSVWDQDQLTDNNDDEAVMLILMYCSKTKIFKISYIHIFTWKLLKFFKNILKPILPKIEQKGFKTKFSSLSNKYLITLWNHLKLIWKSNNNFV